MLYLALSSFRRSSSAATTSESRSAASLAWHVYNKEKHYFLLKYCVRVAKSKQFARLALSLGISYRGVLRRHLVVEWDGVNGRTSSNGFSSSFFMDEKMHGVIDHMCSR